MSDETKRAIDLLHRVNQFQLGCEQSSLSPIQYDDALLDFVDGLVSEAHAAGVVEGQGMMRLYSEQICVNLMRDPLPGRDSLEVMLEHLKSIEKDYPVPEYLGHLKAMLYPAEQAGGS